MEDYDVYKSIRHTSKFSLLPPGTEEDYERGRVPRFDYFIDGRALSSMLYPGRVVPENVVPLEEPPTITMRKLFELETETDIGPGIIPLYVCPEDWDPLCGCVVVRAQWVREFMVWEQVCDADFCGSADDRNQYEWKLTPIAGVGPFRFDALQFRAALDAIRWGKHELLGCCGWDPRPFEERIASLRQREPCE